MKQEIDGIVFEARDVVNLRFLKPYGTVFYVFDYMDSGNLCFGVKGPYGKLFIKYAGSRTMNYMGKVKDAVATLKNAMPLYLDRPPHALVPLLSHGPVYENQGYAAIFKWMDLPCLRAFPPDASVLDRLRHLPLPTRLQMLDDVFHLHADLSLKGYIPVDFDESNLLVDFDEGRMYVCDIDRYHLGSFINETGRMPGHGLLRAPEEYIRGAEIDERTAVYNMGKLAFELLGDPDNPRRRWDGPPLLHKTALTAVEKQKLNRFPSLRVFLRAWRAAVGNSLIL